MVVVLLGGWLTYRQFRGGAGPLQVWHNARLTAPGKVGQPFVWGTVLLKNPTDHALTIDELTVQTGKLQVKTLALGKPEDWPVGGLYSGWPPDPVKPGTLVSPQGMAVPQHGDTLIFGQLVMPHPGRYPIGPHITIDYHIGHTHYQKDAKIWADVLYTKKG